MIDRLEPAVPLLQVFDMQKSLTFYCDVLGFKVVDKTDHDWWAMVRLGDATLMLNTAYEDNKRPARAEPKRVRGHNDVALYFEFVDLDGLSEDRLRVWHVTAPGSSPANLASTPAKRNRGRDVLTNHGKNFGPRSPPQSRRNRPNSHARA